MASLDLSSDLLEVTFSPEERQTAEQFSDKYLSLQLLQNTRVGLIRQLATFRFGEEDTTEKDIRAHVYLRGQLDALDALIERAHNPTPLPEQEP